MVYPMTCVCPKRGIDYYGVLGINSNSHDLEIQKAFRRLAIRHNPGAQSKDESSEAIFPLVAEAYDVLSDPFKRAVYDQYGEEGLKNGVPGPKDYIPPYVYHGQPMRTYREFFGTDSPYADLLDILSKPADFNGCPEGRGVKSKEESIVRPLPLTLSEVFYGGLKKMKIQKLVFATEEKVETIWSEKILNIPIQPGIPTGTKIVFPKEGDEGPSQIPADIIFITEDRPHEVFTRERANLLMTVRIFLREALIGTVITVKTIDERIIRVPITTIVTPQYKKKVRGEGLPLLENPKMRGDLIMSFDIEYPVYMSMSNKNHVRKAFKSRNEINEDPGIGKVMHGNVDSDMPLRRDPEDDLEKSQLLCNEESEFGDT